MIAEALSGQSSKAIPTGGTFGRPARANSAAQWLGEMDRRSVPARYFDPPLDESSGIAVLEGWILESER